MAIDDNTSYELTGLQVKDLAQKVKAKVDSSSLAAVATSGDYTDLLNTPTIPTVNDATLTITQNGTTAGTFTANSSSDTTISLTDTTYTHFTGATAAADGTQGLVPGPLAGDDTKFLSGDGTWKTVSSGSSYTAGNGISIDANNEISIDDTVVAELSDLPTDFTGATSSVAGAHGLVPAPSAGDQDKVLHGDGTWAEPAAKLVEMSYGESNAWAKFIAAYNAGSIVYCRASSNANPATGSQTRKAFMAYVNNATSPTNVEFQYVRSMSSKTDSQQCDQVFVYTLTNASGGTWSVATRNMAPKINVSGPITKTFSNGANATVTIGANAMTGATSSAAGTAGIVPAPAAGDDTKVLSGAGTWVNQPTVNNGTLTIQQNGTTVDTFTANQATGTTVDIDIHNGVMTADNLSPTADTTAAWGTLLGEEGVYWTFYSQSGCFAAQPQTFGYLETILHRNTADTYWEIYQRWHSQAAGHEYYRSGNGNGWYNEASNAGAFRRIPDDSDGVGEAITIYAATNQTITTPTATYGAGVVVPLATATTTFDSDLFELYNGGVRVKKAGTYLVQANFMIDNHKTNGVYAIPQTYKNANAMIACCYERSYSTANIWYGGSLAARTIEANANDVFYLRAASSVADYSYRFAGQNFTFLTVQKIS